MHNDNIGKTFLVATLLCIVCSVMVSSAAVFLKSDQERNKFLDKKKNILLAAGLMKGEEEDIDTLFSQIQIKIVDLSSGTYVEDIDPQKYDQRKAAKDSESNFVIPRKKDLGGIKYRAKYAPVYLVKEGDQIQKVILPVHGKGLWSTMYGFIALDKGTTTVKGFAFYDHGETPGLGGEVDNPKWKALWPEKKIFNESWQVAVEVIKGNVVQGNPKAQHQVDGLAGATITSRGVQNLLRFWLGDLGFGPYLAKLRQEGGSNGY